MIVEDPEQVVVLLLKLLLFRIAWLVLGRMVKSRSPAIPIYT